MLLAGELVDIVVGVCDCHGLIPPTTGDSTIALQPSHSVYTSRAMMLLLALRQTLLGLALGLPVSLPKPDIDLSKIHYHRSE